MNFKITLILLVISFSLLVLIKPNEGLAAESGLCDAGGGVQTIWYDGKSCNWFTSTYFKYAQCNNGSVDSEDTKEPCNGKTGPDAICQKGYGGVKGLLNKVCNVNSRTLWQYVECNDGSPLYDDTNQSCSPENDQDPTSSVCEVSYSLDPSVQNPNTNSTVTFPYIWTGNANCVALFQDGKPQSCSLDKFAPNGLKCTINSGNPGPHTLQLKYGQSSLYPGFSCGSQVSCNTTSYTTKNISPSIRPTIVIPSPTLSPVVTPTPSTAEHTIKYQVAYDELPTDWSTIPEQDYPADNLRIKHTFSSTPGDKFIFVKFKTNKGREEVRQLKIVLLATFTR